jgi:mannose-binding lectin 1
MSSPPPVTNKIPEPNPGTSPNDIPSFSGPPETPASQYQSSAEQFSDLHNRLQAMMRNFNALHNIFNEEKQQAHIRHEELMGHIVRGDNSLERIEKMMKKIEELQADVRQTKSDLHNALDRHVAGLRGEVRSTHSSKLPFLLFILLKWLEDMLMGNSYVEHSSKHGHWTRKVRARSLGE